MGGEAQGMFLSRHIAHKGQDDAGAGGMTDEYLSSENIGLLHTKVRLPHADKNLPRPLMAEGPDLILLLAGNTVVAAIFSAIIPI